MPPSPQHSPEPSYPAREYHSPVAVNDNVYGAEDPKPLTREAIEEQIKAHKLALSLNFQQTEEGRKHLEDDIQRLEKILASLTE